MKLEILTLDGKPIILEKKPNGKYEITKEELVKIVDQAFKAGEQYAKVPNVVLPSVQPIDPISPTTPSPTWPGYPNSPYWYDKPYCHTGDPIPTDIKVTLTSGKVDSGEQETIDLKTNSTYTTSWITSKQEKKNGKRN